MASAVSENGEGPNAPPQEVVKEGPPRLNTEAVAGLPENSLAQLSTNGDHRSSSPRVEIPLTSRTQDVDVSRVEGGSPRHYLVATPSSHANESALDAPLTHSGVVMQGVLHSGIQQLHLARELDVRAAFAGLPRVNAHWTHRYMKILVVGEAGIGKTTFIRNLFAAYAPDPNFRVSDAPKRSAHKTFALHPEQMCTEVTVRDPERHICYHYAVQDTPAYGDGTDLRADRQAVLDYVRACDEAYRESEANPGRGAARTGIPDPRVDAALFFFAPHTLRENDLEFVRELAKVVPVVPILAKADAMTSAELAEQRTRVADALSRRGAAWTFSHAALHDAGAHAGPPFAVVGGQDMDLAVGRFWPVRRYPWGRVEALLTRHSDLPALRRLLFETAYEDLKDSTENRYYEFKTKQNNKTEIVRSVVSPVRSVARLAEFAIGVAALIWLGSHARPLLVDAQHRQRVVADVRSGISAARDRVQDHISRISHDARHAKETVKSKAGEAMEEIVTGKEKRRKPFWKFWGK